jgi:hypothetical protein
MLVYGTKGLRASPSHGKDDWKRKPHYKGSDNLFLVELTHSFLRPHDEAPDEDFLSVSSHAMQ